jgi:hypothetical protein
MAQRMHEVVALGCVMDEADWNDSDIDEDVEDESGCKEQYEPCYTNERKCN